MKNRMYQMLGLFFLWSSVAVSFNGQAEEEFVIRRYDVIVSTSGKQFQGKILSEDGGRIRMRMGRSGAVQYFNRQQVRSILHRATPEIAVENKLKKQTTARALAEVAKAGLKRFPDNHKVVEVVVKYLSQKSTSGDPLLLSVLGGLYLEIRQPEKAKALAESLIARKDTPEHRLMLGRALEALGKTKEALESLKKAYAQAPDNGQIMVGYAELLLKAGKAAEARKVFTDALDKNPRMVSALIGQGYVRLRQGNTTEAAMSFQKALEIDSNNLNAKVGMAACKVMSREYGEAIRMAEQVLTYDNRNGRAYGLQGYAHLLGGEGKDLPLALNKLDESLRESPHDSRVKVLKAVALHRYAEWLMLSDKSDEAAKRRVEASQLLADIEANKPSDSVLLYLLAWMRYSQAIASNNTDALALAADGFRNTVNLAPQFAPAHQAVGCIALRMRKWEEAENAYAKAIELDPKVAEYYAGNGLAMLGKKRLQQAQEQFKKAKDLDPRNVAALCGLGYIANFEKNEASAKELFGQALAADGQCAYAADALQKIFKQRGQSLKYLTFSDGDPIGWRAAKGRGGSVKPKVEEGKVRWRGTTSSAASRNMEYMTTVSARNFVRFEADLEIEADQPGSLVMRIASKKGAAVTFYVEFGKNEGKQLAYRFRDYSGMPADWRIVPNVPWPKKGRIRLAMETSDLNSGVLHLFVNGVEKGHLELRLKSPKKIAVGVSASAPGKTTINASADNISLLLREDESEGSSTRHGELIGPDEK